MLTIVGLGCTASGRGTGRDHVAQPRVFFSPLAFGSWADMMLGVIRSGGDWRTRGREAAGRPRGKPPESWALAVFSLILYILTMHTLSWFIYSSVGEMPSPSKSIGGIRTFGASVPKTVNYQGLYLGVTAPNSANMNPSVGRPRLC